MKRRLLCILWISFFIPLLTFAKPANQAGAQTGTKVIIHLPIVFNVESYSPEPRPTQTPSATTPAPIVTPMPTQPATLPGWLAYLNRLRALGNLPALTESPEWNSGCWFHSRYMVKNDLFDNLHSEDPSNRWYTLEGLTAAQSSDLLVSSSTGDTDQAAIDLWLSGPFHGIGILDPKLKQTGFNSYRETGGSVAMGACLDVIRGLSYSVPDSIYPIYWPGNDVEMPYTQFYGHEWPDPLTSCPGYTPPTGTAIYLQIGSGSSIPLVTDHWFKRGDGTLLTSCFFDETSYTNPDTNAQKIGRAILDSRDAIVLIPRQPLQSRTWYTVSITSNGIPYTWSFITGGEIPYTSSIMIK